ncbi:MULTISPECIES: SMP-30/gluconolactonase/LRE family protein [unclassified Imperialibacter]|uniref:SMP-30/gluconolactonase/LRE family protein n=1 Tax=unclassified Imperialibacter TaxID=2629706 RepID=UPI001258B72E|nr:MULTISPECIES: gluconolaconase [unclassified Imperialibacter]CAD5271375.1 Gluconolaconase [Imperialibacter sp. 89]CAD5298774.1 Gluconolaconase [Imperialibacter sp. 75]VVT35046.1 Gluconolaconase [Imperialibacter sp. EC-SDR9]
MKKLSYLLAAAVLVACQSGKKTEEAVVEETPATTVSLVKKWETDTTLTTPESVYYDVTNGVLYVACIGAVPPDAKDGDGFIAKVGLDGAIIDTQWVVGLDGPKGMGMVGNLLYVSNIDEVVEIDVNTGEITNRFPVDGASFLNDITVDASGTVYISDSGVSKIFALSNGAVALWTEGEVLGGPNGLLAEDGRLMVASFGAGKFSTISIADKDVKMVVDSIPGGDGVVALDGDYFVSNWNGEVYYVTEDWKKTKLLDTKAAGANAADIEIAADQSLLFVPTFFGNTVVAYDIVKE